MPYHIAGNGKPDICDAEPGNCPLGGAHHATIEGALAGRITALFDGTAPAVTSPAAVRAEFLHGSSDSVRRQLAINKETPTSVLSVLAESHDSTTREYAAANPNISAPALTKLLAAETELDVFRAASRNKQLTPQHVRALAVKLDDTINGNLARRADLTADVQTLFTTSAVSRHVHMLMARNPSAPVAHDELVGHDDYLNRALAANPNLNPNLLQALSTSTDEETRNTATAALAARRAVA